MIVPSKPKISDPITGSRQPEYFTEPVTSSTFNNDPVEFTSVLLSSAPAPRWVVDSGGGRLRPIDDRVLVG